MGSVGGTVTQLRPLIADESEQPAPIRLALTYRVRSHGKRALNREEIFAAAKLTLAQRVWTEQRARTPNKHRISIANEAIHARFNPNIGAEDPMQWVMSFAKRCRRRYSSLFEIKAIAEHELFVGFFLKTPTELAAIMLNGERLSLLNEMRFSLQLAVYQSKESSSWRMSG